jgi:hypothetical protein
MTHLYYIGNGREDFDYSVRDPRDGSLRQVLAIPDETKRLALTPIKAGPGFVVWAELPPQMDDRQLWEPVDEGAGQDLYVVAASPEEAEAQLAAFQEA